MKRRKVVMLGLVLLIVFVLSVNVYSDVMVPEDIRLDTDETSESNGSSKDPKISSDGEGHVYVTWYDYINGKTDIYFNYSNDYGVTWQTSEIRLDTGDTAGASTSLTPKISSDGSGHVYVSWYDYRNGSADIYFNYSSNYGVTWQTSDIRLDIGNTAGASTSLDPEISSDSSGHVYVTWYDYRNGSADIFFNYSSNYGATWQANDIRLDTGDTAGGSGSEVPQISSDSSGHVYVTWYDYRNGSADIFFNYSNDYGATWQTSDIRLDTGDTAGVNDSGEPLISSDDSGHVYVTWQDERNGNSDIYFNYSSDYGATWQTSDIRLDTGDTVGASESEEPHISSDGSGHVYVTWQDFRNGNSDIYFNYSSDYGVTWQTSDIRLDTGDTAGASWSEEHSINNDGNGHVYVTWQDGRKKNEFDIYLNYSNDYGVTWQANDIRLNVREEGWSYNPEISSEGNGHVYVTWHKLTYGSIDIYFDYSSDYGVTWQASNIRLDTSDFTGSWFFDPKISSDGSGYVYVAWVDAGQGIYFNHSSNNGVTWQANYIRLNANDIYNENLSCCDAGHQIDSDDNGHVYVTWFDGRNENADIYFNYSSDYGATWQTNDIRLDTGDTEGASASLDPRISSDDSGHVYVTWQDERNGDEDIYFNYSSNYGATWQTNDIRLDTGDTAGASDSWEPQISSDGSGHVYVTWQDERNGDEDIYFNYSSNYGVTWQTSGTRLDTGDTSGTSDSWEPRISSDVSGHIYVIWNDDRNGKTDIYFNYSSDYGATWQTNDIRLDTGDTAGTNDSWEPQISSDGSGHVYVTWTDERNGYVIWTDERNGNTDIYFNYSSDYGVTWQASDIRLDTGDTAGANDSGEPLISSDGSGHVYVTWQDERNGDEDIYFNYSSNYGVTWQTNDIRLDTGDTAGASESEEPRISNDGSGYVYVTWTDLRSGRTDIYFNSLYISEITAPPVPDIKANNSDSSITIGTGDTLSVNVSLSSETSTNCDWWVAESTPDGWYYYSLSTSWTFAGSSYTNLSPTYQGALFDLNTYEVLNTSGLSEGTHTFYFAVDTNMNGSLDMGSIYYDSVEVNVKP